MTSVRGDDAPEHASRHLLFLVEESSMKHFLEGVLPRIVSPNTFRVIAFNGKHDLLKKLQDRLSGLKRSMLPGQRMFVLVDRDSQDCHELKQQLERIATDARLITRTADDRDWQLVNRIVVEELEAWYFGDWEAVRSAYARAPKGVSRRAQYRNPDAVHRPSGAFERVMSSEFPYGLRKVEASRQISRHFDPTRSRSQSFRVFYDAVLEAVA